MVRPTTDGTTDESGGNTTGTVATGYHYKDPATCNLYLTGHKIAADFHDVFQAFEDAFDHDDAEVVAGGCNTCTTIDDDVDVWASYVAQRSHNTDRLYVGFGARDDATIGDKLVAYTLIGIAEAHDVPVSWNGDVGKCVCLGDADAYDDAGGD